MYEIHVIDKFTGKETVEKVETYNLAITTRNNHVYNNGYAGRVWISPEGTGKRWLEWSRYDR